MLGIVALSSTAAMLALILSGWLRQEPRVEEMQSYPTAVERFKEISSQSHDPFGKTPPLVVQARILASYLEPGPQAKDAQPSRSRPAARREPVPAIRPAAPSVKFRLLGTSYYPNQPERSMALISELGRPDGTRKWVKEGSQLSHFVLHEVRRGAIVLHDGNDLREMTVEHRGTRPSLVRDVWSGSRKVSTATSHGAATPAGPNNVEVDGGD